MNIGKQVFLLEQYEGRYYSKIGLNFTLMIFPLLLLFLYLQKSISMPVSTRIIVIRLVLFAIPLIFGSVGVYFGFKGNQGQDYLGKIVLILALASLGVCLWLAVWFMFDLSLLYQYGFLVY